MIFMQCINFSIVYFVKGFSYCGRNKEYLNGTSLCMIWKLPPPTTHVWPFLGRI